MIIWKMFLPSTGRVKRLAALSGILVVTLLTTACDDASTDPALEEPPDSKERASATFTLSLAPGGRETLLDPPRPAIVGAEGEASSKSSAGVTTRVDEVETGGVDVNVTGNIGSNSVSASVTSSSGLENASKLSGGDPLYPTNVTLNPYTVDYGFNGASLQQSIPSDVQTYIQQALDPYVPPSPGGSDPSDPSDPPGPIDQPEPIATAQSSSPSKSGFESRLKAQGFDVVREGALLKASSRRGDSGIVTTLSIDPETGEVQSSVIRGPDGNVLYRQPPR